MGVAGMWSLFLDFQFITLRLHLVDIILYPVFEEVGNPLCALSTYTNFIQLSMSCLQVLTDFVYKAHRV